MFSEISFLHVTDEFVHALKNFQRWLELHIEAEKRQDKIPFEVGDIVRHRLNGKRLIVVYIDNNEGRYPVSCRSEDGNIEAFDASELECRKS